MHLSFVFNVQMNPVTWLLISVSVYEGLFHQPEVYAIENVNKKDRSRSIQNMYQKIRMSGDNISVVKNSVATRDDVNMLHVFVHDNCLKTAIHA